MFSKLIILIEDDINLRFTIALILRRAGYIVTDIACVHKAIEILQSSKYNLVISDINVAETINVLIPEIISTYPSLPMVLLTDESFPKPLEDKKLLSVHYLVKTFDPECLLESVGSILGEKRN